MNEWWLQSPWCHSPWLASQGGDWPIVLYDVQSPLRDTLWLWLMMMTRWHVQSVPRSSLGIFVSVTLRGSRVKVGFLAQPWLGHVRSCEVTFLSVDLHFSNPSWYHCVAQHSKTLTNRSLSSLWNVTQRSWLSSGVPFTVEHIHTMGQTRFVYNTLRNMSVLRLKLVLEMILTTPSSPRCSHMCILICSRWWPWILSRHTNELMVASWLL